jgi:four helix bundle protein
MIKSYTDLEIYTLSYNLAMDIFKTSRKFPAEEKYSLTSQIVRSSRSICANIAEGFGRRAYLAEFKKHLILFYRVA